MKTPLLMALTLVLATAFMPTMPLPPITEAPAASTTMAVHGIYEGTLPCHFCTGIRTVLELGPDRSFEAVEFFEGSGDSTKTNVVKGTYQIQRGRPGNSRAVVVKLSQATSISRYIEVINDFEIRMLDEFERPFDVGLAYSLYKR